MVINFAQSRVSIGFSCTVSKIQKLVFLILLAHGKSYKHAFSKTYNGHKHCSKSRAETIEFRSVFRAPSRKFKILANPNVLADGKSYELVS
ncbi:hypothetical protein B296_00057927 [Ensete ventricosum]|uniref:Uncharacterized protein n=1 Tax=Ensete ventricosum TaxID=4639 RepID=A0A426WX45_ENSVE|nr:hypothetical protein B296_00057927 [Ensete ventricosum]